MPNHNRLSLLFCEKKKIDEKMDIFCKIGEKKLFYFQILGKMKEVVKRN